MSTLVMKSRRSTCSPKSRGSRYSSIYTSRMSIEAAPRLNSLKLRKMRLYSKTCEIKLTTNPGRWSSNTPLGTRNRKETHIIKNRSQKCLNHRQNPWAKRKWQPSGHSSHSLSTKGIIYKDATLKLLSQIQFYRSPLKGYRHTTMENLTSRNASYFLSLSKFSYFILLYSWWALQPSKTNLTSSSISNNLIK